MSDETFNPESPGTVDLLLRRRSIKSRTMMAPGPTPEQLEQILRAGLRVPDHGKLAPWRFLVFEGDSRERLADAIANAYCREEGVGTEHAAVRKFREMVTVPPCVVIVASTPVLDGKPIPLWEQQLSAAAACQNMLVAATALGVGTQWLTGWPAYSAGVRDFLELTGPEDRVAGFLFLAHTPIRRLNVPARISRR